MAPRKIFKIQSRSGLGLKLNAVTSPIVQLRPNHESFPEVKPIQGMIPDSKEEYWVALALYRLHLDFEYQHQLFGGRKYKGGQVIDFWVFTVPLPTPIFVQGWYFHYATAQKAAESKLNLMYLEARLRGKAMKPVELLDIEMPTPEDAYILTKRKLNK